MVLVAVKAVSSVAEGDVRMQEV